MKKKILSLAIATAMLASSAQAAEYATAVTGMAVKDGSVQSMTIDKGEEANATGIAAVYGADGRLVKLVLSGDDLSGNGEKTVSFSGELAIGSGEILKGFVWKSNDDGMTIEPMSGAFVWNGAAEETTEPTIEVTTEPTEEVTTEPTTNVTEEPSEENMISAFKYTDQTTVSTYNTDGIAQAVLSASEDGTNETALTIAAGTYADENGTKNSPVLSPVNGWGENPYVQVAISTLGYTDIAVSAKIGATKKGPANYTLQYSTDGTTFNNIAEYTLTANKTLFNAFVKESIPNSEELDMLYIRITPADTITVAGGTLSGTSGEFAVNDIIIYGTATGNATAEPIATPEPEDTPVPDEPMGDGIIHLLGSEVNAAGVAGVTVDGTTVTITEAGEYTIEGTLDEGQIVVSSTNASDEIKVNLNNVSVTSASNDPFSGKKGNIILVPMTDTENTFTTTDGAAINVKNDLTIKGEGKINAISENGNGIRSKGDLEIGVCDLYVKAGNNGIKGDGSVKVTKKNKSITIESVNDGIKSDTAPMATDAETGEVIGGTVTINGGEITITTGTATDAETGEVSTGDGIQADTMLTITGGTLKINATGEGLKANASSIAHYEDTTSAETLPDGDGQIVISGGTVEINAGEDAIKAVKKVSVSGGDITITKGLEGIQVNEVIYGTDGETVLYQVDGEIEISGGSIDITCSEDGIQCGTGDVVITDGNVKVNSYMDAIQAENVLNISGGTFDIVTYGGSPTTASEKNPEAANSCKGLKARTLVNISGGTFTIDTYDDAIHSNNTVRISGGEIEAATGDDGVHGDSYLYISGDADINVTKSYEGIEAAEIYISGGVTRVVSTDDGANAAGEKPTGESATLSAGPGGGFNGGGNWGQEDNSSYGYLEVSGGILYIEAEGDGFDSNGSALISGGYVLVNGPTSGGNGVFDIGDNSGDTLHITGGVVIGAGTSDMAVTPDTTTNSQAYVVATGGSSGGMNRPGGSSSSSSGFTSQSAGKAFKLCDASGNEIATYVPSKTHAWVFVSTPEMTSGSKYTLYYGGSVSGGTVSGSKDGKYGLVTSGTFSGNSSVSLTSTK